MNLKVSGLGAEPKKMAVLVLLGVVAIYFYFSNRTPSEATPTVQRTATTTAAHPTAVRTTARPAGRVSRGGQRGQLGGLQEFRPSLKPKKGEEINRADIDPTLRLDLLDKIQNVPVEGGTRSLFEVSAAPPVQTAKLVKEPPKVIPATKMIGPMPAPVALRPVEPQAPPIPLKFYGFVNPQKVGSKRAFFLDGEDIIVATEGQLIKSRYKIVRIGVNSAVVEDTQFKNSQQTLPLVEEQAG